MDPVTLQAQCQLLEREREVLLATLADLRQRLDAADSERRTAQERLTALLTHQTEKQQNIPPEPRSSLLEKLFGRRW
jgi:chromosome segregation ATPase